MRNSQLNNDNTVAEQLLHSHCLTDQLHVFSFFLYLFEIHVYICFVVVFEQAASCNFEPLANAIYARTVEGQINHLRNINPEVIKSK